MLPRNPKQLTQGSVEWDFSDGEGSTTPPSPPNCSDTTQVTKAKTKTKTKKKTRTKMRTRSEHSGSDFKAEQSARPMPRNQPTKC